jgi:hypothetical protein
MTDRFAAAALVREPVGRHHASGGSLPRFELPDEFERSARAERRGIPEIRCAASAEREEEENTSAIWKTNPTRK